MKSPYILAAGDSLDMQVEVPDYPAMDGWTLTYYLVPRFTTPAQSPIVLTCSANADGTYQLQAGPAATATWKAGAYGWRRRVTKTGAAQSLTGSEDQGELTVLDNPVDLVQGYDSRSHSRKMLEAIEAAVEALRVSAKAYSIGSRSYTRADVAELLAMRSKYQWEVADEDARDRLKAGMPNPRGVGVRLVR